jgi:hypothetical protein
MIFLLGINGKSHCHCFGVPLGHLAPKRPIGATTFSPVFGTKKRSYQMVKIFMIK